MTGQRDINNDISVVSTQLPNVRTATAQGTTVDRSGFRAAAFVAHVGTIANGTFAFDPEDSDDGSAWADVAPANLSGTFVDADSSADETVQEVGYMGTRRYVRCNLTVSGSPAGGGPIGVSVVLGEPRTSPA